MGTRSKRRREVQPVPHALMASSPHPFIMGGKTYVMSPLSDADWGTLDSWMQERTLEIARRMIQKNPGIDDFAKREIYGEAMRIAARISVATPEGAAMLVTLDGCALMTWLGLQKKHPEITFEQVRAELIDPKKKDSALNAFDVANATSPRRNPTTVKPQSSEATSPTNTPTTEQDSTASSPNTTVGPPQ